MIVQQFQIYFDNPYGTYYAGQVVTGKVVAKVLLPIRIQGVELNFHGEARVEWSESKQERDDDGNMQTIAHLYSSNEMYFDNNIYILGGPGCNMLLQAGDHMYTFSMQLPAVLPSSFEGRLGNVRYHVLGTLMCVDQNNFQHKAFFTVLNQLDLNRMVAVKDRVQIVEDKFLCCCCCKSGPITAVVTLPASGFVPGQHIPLTIEVDNNTNKTLSSVMCTLQKVVIFTTTRPSKQSRSDTQKICQLVLGGVGANDSCTWSEKMAVPSLPPSLLQHCSIIDINYCLVVEVKIPGMHRNMSVFVPITIGTVPLYYGNPPQLQPQPQPGVAPTAPPMAAALPPPTYEECAFWGQGDPSQERHDPYRNAVFQPKYPMYKF